MTLSKLLIADAEVEFYRSLTKAKGFDDTEGNVEITRERDLGGELLKIRELAAKYAQIAVLTHKLITDQEVDGARASSPQNIAYVLDTALGDSEYLHDDVAVLFNLYLSEEIEKCVSSSLST